MVPSDYESLNPIFVGYHSVVIAGLDIVDDEPMAVYSNGDLQDDNGYIYPLAHESLKSREDSKLCWEIRGSGGREGRGVRGGRGGREEEGREGSFEASSKDLAQY
ncbi:predicted protein [Arabidopsis lyrata subsp. lyrata]|uniref:Predicted protein n=1 Tax=Arabidopsis lyrata subsp. lyrata TaxID=81972 RepID=D7LM95_ARALL|nr:predicted protein [Arabidopsis lyrata subsp. lyrata]